MFNLCSKKVGIISLLLLLFVSMSCVCAQDVGVNSTNSDISDLNQESSVVVSQNVSGSFSELNNDLGNLSSGDTYNFNKDYYFNSTVDSAFVDGICINVSNVVINGNDHVISGNNISSIFKVYGNNVKIINLNFMDANGIRESVSDPQGLADYIAVHKYSYNSLIPHHTTDAINAKIESNAKKLFPSWYVGSSSPVTWYGDNGVISNCVFMSNTAINGGALTWRGNNGTIRNVDFVNNTARAIGGSINVIGQNNAIEGCNFINSFSKLSYEAIFFDYDATGNHISGNNVSGNGRLACTCVSKFNTDCFYKPVMYQIYSNVYINLVDYAYLSFLSLGNGFNNGNFSYSGVKNDNGFNLNFNKFYKNHDIKYVKQDLSSGGIDIVGYVPVLCGDFNHIRVINFNNVNCIDDVIKSLYACNYTIEDVVLANYTFTGKDLSILNTLSFKNDILGNIIPENVTYVLNINLPAGESSSFNGPLNLPEQYNVINIIGNGFKITAKSGLRDEHHLLVLEKNQVVTFNNVIISGFNTALRLDNGICILNNVVFDGNKLDYRVSKDWGGAILNTAACFCNNCTFINNFAQNGGAIFNGGILYIDSATSFNNNYAKSNGDNILNVDKGEVYLDNVKINGTTGKVRYVSSYSDLKNIGAVVISALSSFVVGVVAGLIAGPVVGVAVGAAFGAIAGGVSYKVITDHNFDVHFNRIKWAAICIGTSVAAGILGGILGGAIHNACAEETFYKVNTLEDNEWGYKTAETYKSPNGSTKLVVYIEEQYYGELVIPAHV